MRFGFFADWFPNLNSMSSMQQSLGAGASPSRVAASVSEPAASTPKAASHHALLIFAAGRAPSDVANFLFAHPSGSQAREAAGAGAGAREEDTKARALGMLWALESRPAMHGKWA